VSSFIITTDDYIIERNSAQTSHLIAPTKAVISGIEASKSAQINHLKAPRKALSIGILASPPFLK
jgi:hypothetical protein